MAGRFASTCLSRTIYGSIGSLDSLASDNRGYWYSFPFWMYSVPGPSYGSSHVRWCLNRYRSYNPRTDLFKGYDGRYHRCRSPYRR